MPLIHSGSKAALHDNMRTLMGEIGKSPHVQSRAQAVAIALDNQRRNRADGGIANYELGGAIRAATLGRAENSNRHQAEIVAAQQTQDENEARALAPPDDKAKDHARGGVANRALGGFGGVDMAKGPMRPSWEERSAARSLHVGPVLSAVPGRADNHRISVPSGSYVLPAAHIASMGHGNSVAGLAAASRMFGPQPASTATMFGGMPKIAHGSGPPRPPRMGHFADGGYSEGGARGEGDHVPVDVNVSGGEYIIPPWIVRQIGHGSLKNGHAILDSWVMQARKREIETQRKLPPPAKR